MQTKTTWSSTRVAGELQLTPLTIKNKRTKSFVEVRSAWTYVRYVVLMPPQTCFIISVYSWYIFGRLAFPQRARAWTRNNYTWQSNFSWSWCLIKDGFMIKKTLAIFEVWCSGGVLDNLLPVRRLRLLHQENTFNIASRGVALNEHDFARLTRLTL